MRSVHRLAFAVAALLVAVSTPSHAYVQPDACSKTLGGCYAGCKEDGQKLEQCYAGCQDAYVACKNP